MGCGARCVHRCSGDREKKFEQVFTAAKLDGAAMTTMNGRGVEVAVRNATQGEGWVDDLQKVGIRWRCTCACACAAAAAGNVSALPRMCWPSLGRAL